MEYCSETRLCLSLCLPDPKTAKGRSPSGNIAVCVDNVREGDKAASFDIILMVLDLIQIYPIGSCRSVLIFVAVPMPL